MINKKIVNMKLKYGDDINDIAKKMLELAKVGIIVKTTFNGALLTTENAFTTDDIIKQRDDYFEEQYKDSAEQNPIKELEHESNIEILKQKLETLNLDNKPELLGYLSEIAKERADYFFNRLVLVPALEQRGYISLKEFKEHYPNKNMTVQEYITYTDDLEEVANYLVSIAIQDIKDSGSISDVMIYFIKFYQERLNKEKIRKIR